MPGSRSLCSRHPYCAFSGRWVLGRSSRFRSSRRIEPCRRRPCIAGSLDVLEACGIPSVSSALHCIDGDSTLKDIPAHKTYKVKMRMPARHRSARFGYGVKADDTAVRVCRRYLVVLVVPAVAIFVVGGTRPPCFCNFLKGCLQNLGLDVESLDVCFHRAQGVVVIRITATFYCRLYLYKSRGSHGC